MAGRPCRICENNRREEIDAAITDGIAFRRIAAQFVVTEQSIRRHSKGCLKSAVKAARTAREAATVKTGMTTMDRLEDTLKQTLGIVEQAQAEGDLRLALSGLGEVRKHIELSAKLLGEIRSGEVSVGVTTFIAPMDWERLRNQIVLALKDFPEAINALVRDGI